MKKIIFITFVVLALALVLFSCYEDEAKPTLADDGTGVKMTAIVKNIGDKIEVEVIEGDYGAEGIYWVNYSNETVITNSENVRLSVDDLKVGDTIEITYGGQVAMSYPPQIFAKKIIIK